MMRKKYIQGPEPVTSHVYHDNIFSPEGMHVYNINEIHALDPNLNSSRVSHFISRLPSLFPFLPTTILPRMEKILTSLHYGWCSEAMHLIRGELNLIRKESEQKEPDDHFIAHAGKSVEKLLDTFEIATRIDEMSAAPLEYGAKLRGKYEAHGQYILGEPHRCHLTALVVPEIGLARAPKQNGVGPSSSGGKQLSSIFHHITPASKASEAWQLFFSVLVQNFELAAYYVHENIETENGHLDSSHLADLYRISHFITRDEGCHLYAALRQYSVLFDQKRYTCDAARAKRKRGNVDEDRHSKMEAIDIDMSEFEHHPCFASDPHNIKRMTKRCNEWYSYILDMITEEATHTRTVLLEFILILSSMPLPFQYLTLYYIAAAPLLFSFERFNRSEYFDWIIHGFVIARFFCGLASVSESDYEKMLKFVRNRKLQGKKVDSKEDDDIQIPSSIVREFRKREGVSPYSSDDDGDIEKNDDDDDDDGAGSKASEELFEMEPSPNDVLIHWPEFVQSRDRMRTTLKSSSTTGIWSAFKWHFRYHHLYSRIIRWRWCSHVMKSGRFNSSRYSQIDRELAYLRSCMSSPTLDGAQSFSMSSGLTTDSANESSQKPTEDAAKTSSKSKKKKKKSNNSSSTYKPMLLAPNEDPLQFLRPEFHPDAYIPKKFSGKNSFVPELERLVNSAQKQCGDPSIASDIFVKLLEFPRAIRLIVLMHLSKKPFPDHPFELVNLWKVIPTSHFKEDRANFILTILELVSALAELNRVWQDAIYDPVPTCPTESMGESIHTAERQQEKDGTGKSKSSSKSKKKKGRNNAKDSDSASEMPVEENSYHIASRFYEPTTSPSVVKMPRILISDLDQGKNLLPKKIRLENGLCWGKGTVTPEQQKWVQAWWNVAHSFITGCRTISLLVGCNPLASQGDSPATADDRGFKCLLEQLRVFSSTPTNEGVPHSKVLQSVAPFGSHVLLEKSREDASDNEDDEEGEDMVQDDKKDENDENEEDEDAAERNPNGVHPLEPNAKYIPCFSSLSYALDCELAEVFEDLVWTEYDDSSKMHCISIFIDFLYRNWTVSPVVLEFLESNELQAFPLVFQYSIVQQLSNAVTREHQESIVHVLRYAYLHSGLLDMEKDPYSNDVKVKAALESDDQDVDAPLARERLRPSAQSVAEDSGLFNQSSLLAMLDDSSGYNDFSASPGDPELGQRVSAEECPLSPREQSRMAALTFECILMVKLRYQELFELNRWKFGHSESVQNAAMDVLKEEMENAISTIKTLIGEVASGSSKCFQMRKEDAELEGGDMDFYDSEDDSSSERPESVFDAALQELVQTNDCPSETLDFQSPEAIHVCVMKTFALNGFSRNPVYGASETIPKRFVKRFNVRNILWLTRYTDPDFLTSNMLDKMWSTAMK